MYSESMARLIAELAKLPGVGQRTAERLAFHILKASPDDALKLATAITDVKKSCRPCSTCCNADDEDPCHICRDDSRDRGLICVVEQPRDLYAIEKSGQFRGVYHVLMGSVALLDGVEPKDLTFDRLVARCRAGGVREAIIATNPNFDGDATALHVAEALKGLGVKVTRIARGVPAGSALEYASKTILGDALEGRREV